MYWISIRQNIDAIACEWCECVFLWSSRHSSDNFLHKKIHCVVCYFEDWRQPKHNRLCFCLHFFLSFGLVHWRLRDEYTFSPISKNHIKRKTEKQKKKKHKTNVWNIWSYMGTSQWIANDRRHQKLTAINFMGSHSFFLNNTREKKHTSCPNYCCRCCWWWWWWWFCGMLNRFTYHR